MCAKIPFPVQLNLTNCEPFMFEMMITKLFLLPSFHVMKMNSHDQVLESITIIAPVMTRLTFSGNIFTAHDCSSSTHVFCSVGMFCRFSFNEEQKHIDSHYSSQVEWSVHEENSDQQRTF